MSSVVISGDTSGSVSVTVPAIAGSQTATLPAATGTVMVSGNMPAFGVYAGSSTSITANVATKIVFNTKEFDTNTNYDTSTSRFTPTVAGYYQINATVSYGPADGRLSIYKNGSEWKRGLQLGANGVGFTVSAVVSANGSTDYFEIYAVAGSGTATNTTAPLTWFNGSLVRTA